MTRTLRLIGYWDGPAAPKGLPDVCDFVCLDADVTMQRAVAAYLRSGTVFVAGAGVSVCRLCGAANGSTEQTDGDHFVWPEGLAHYVEEHGVRLPDEVAAAAARGAAPAVDLECFTRALLKTGELRVDVDWWYGLAGAGTAGPAAGHLRGCRRSGSAGYWDLPAAADIYVDQVPSDDIVTLAQLRRLLGAQWPFSDLRGLLRSQPFIAAAGNPSRLYRVLASSSPVLRQYLFYDENGELMPVWSDA